MIEIATIFGYDVHVPERGSDEAAGLDVYLPQYTDTFRLEFEERNSTKEFGRIVTPDTGPFISVDPSRRVILPTGLRVRVEPGTYLEVANRGSVAAKQGLIFGAHIIDSDYRGMVFINLINVSSAPQSIQFGQRIAQMLHKQVLMSDVNLVSDSEYARNKTKRGEGSLGSTGK